MKPSIYALVLLQHDPLQLRLFLLLSLLLAQHVGHEYRVLIFAKFDFFFSAFFVFLHICINALILSVIFPITINPIKIEI